VSRLGGSQFENEYGDYSRYVVAASWAQRIVLDPAIRDARLPTSTAATANILSGIK